MNKSDFATLSRQKFRRYFQPSRIVLGILPTQDSESGVNVITLCFDMHCSYKPPMMAVAIQKGSASYDLIENAREWVLAVPGPSLLEETLFCGTKSLREIDKVKSLGLELCPSAEVKVPGLRRAVANIELQRVQCVATGDHVTAIGRVVRFAVAQYREELPLLSIGPNITGYRLLAQRGIHRIGVARAGDGRREAEARDRGVQNQAKRRQRD